MALVAFILLCWWCADDVAAAVTPPAALQQVVTQDTLESLSLLQRSAAVVTTGQRVYAGDSIFLRTHTGKLLTVEAEGAGAHVAARRGDSRGRPGMFIRRKDGGVGALSSGDTVYLAAASGEYLDVEGDMVSARWKDPGDWQAFAVEKLDGAGPLLVGDSVAFRAHTGELLDISGTEVRCNGWKVSPSHTMTVERLPHGSMHDVVGRHGVWMISVDRREEVAELLTPEAEESAAVPRALDALGQAGIFPVVFQATDWRQISPRELQLTCPLEAEEGTTEWCEEMGRIGQPGCKSGVEQAIADSHRRALVAALARDDRDSNWTAIIEEDAVPVMPERFDAAFREAWASVPSETKLVRLGWCTFDADMGPIHEKSLNHRGDFRLVSERWRPDAGGSPHYYTGGCSTGYLVHRSLIPEMLGIFPCCCALDCCLQRQFFYAPATPGVGDGELGRWRGPQIMLDLDVTGSREYSKSLSTFSQSGVLVQDHSVR